MGALFSEQIGKRVLFSMDNLTKQSDQTQLYMATKQSITLKQSMNNITARFSIDWASRPKFKDQGLFSPCSNCYILMEEKKYVNFKLLKSSS